MNKVNRENIILNLSAKTKDEAIKKISTKLYDGGYISNEIDFLDSVIHRENQNSTGIGNGIAIPHGASDAVVKSTVMFAKLENPIDWDSLDSLPVEYVFLLAITKKEHGDSYIRVLANLAKLLMDADFVEGFKRANSLEEIYDSLNRGEN